MGILFGALATNTRSLWPSLAAHVTNNILVLAI
jgi:membrane protease YdiL (CAAX protease family)